MVNRNHSTLGLIIPCCSKQAGSTPGRHILEAALDARTPSLRTRARQYFIDVEKRYLAQQPKPLTARDIMGILASDVVRLEDMVIEARQVAEKATAAMERP